MNAERVDLLKSALQAYAWRTQAAADLDNLDSPGVRPRSISFEESMSCALRPRTKRKLGDVEPEINVQEGPPIL